MRNRSFGTECHTRDGLQFFVQRRPMRHYMPAYEGLGDPLQWWAWRWEDSDDENNNGREWLAGPFDTKRELIAALDRFFEETAHAE